MVKPKKKRPRRYANVTESKLIASMQKWKCKTCKTLLSAFYEIDHIIPYSNGGLTEIDNLQALCVKCHKRKSMLERSGRCTFCLQKTHSKYFPCAVYQKTLKVKKAKKKKHKRKYKKKL